MCSACQVSQCTGLSVLLCAEGISSTVFSDLYHFKSISLTVYLLLFPWVHYYKILLFQFMLKYHSFVFGLALVNLAFLLVIFKLCSFILTFLYPSQRPNACVEISAVLSICGELLWSINKDGGKLSSLLEWCDTSWCTGNIDGIWLSFYTLLIFLASLERSHVRKSSVVLTKIVWRMKILLKNDTAQISDTQGQRSPFTTFSW